MTKISYQEHPRTTMSICDLSRPSCEHPVRCSFFAIWLHCYQHCYQWHSISPYRHVSGVSGGAKDKVAMKHLQLLYPFTDRVSPATTCDAMFGSCFWGKSWEVKALAC